MPIATVTLVNKSPRYGVPGQPLQDIWISKNVSVVIVVDKAISPYTPKSDGRYNPQCQGQYCRNPTSLLVILNRRHLCRRQDYEKHSSPVKVRNSPGMNAAFPRRMENRIHAAEGCIEEICPAPALTGASCGCHDSERSGDGALAHPARVLQYQSGVALRLPPHSI